MARASYRGQVTRLTKAANEYLNSPDSRISDATNLDNAEEELQSYLDRLTSVHQSLHSINKEIHEKNLIKSDEMEREYENIAEYDDMAINALSRIKVRLNKIRSKLHGAAIPEPRPSPSNHLACTKLERLKLTKFSGDPKEWIPFWQQFRVTVHENSGLSGIEKFYYLQSALSGTAQKTIEGFTPSDQCYDGAVSLLLEQYGKPEKLVDLIMQQLMALPHLHNRNDVMGLRNLYNTVVAAARSLTALQVPVAHYSIMLRTILLKALPSELRVEYHRHYDDDSIHVKTEVPDQNESADSASVCRSSSSTLAEGDTNIQGILRFLKREVESLERASVTKNARQTDNAKHRNAPTTAAGLLTTNNPPVCFFCKSKFHNQRECNATLTIDERKKLLSQSGRCFRCLDKGHTSKFCRRAGLFCKKCRRKHATSMCDPSYQQKGTTTVSNGKLRVSDTQNENTNLRTCTTTDTRSDVHSQAANSCVCAASNQHRSVFLQTARVFAMSPYSNTKLFLRIVLDGGSQNTYIRESVADKLQLPVVGTAKMNILPFGGNVISKSERYKLVSLKLKSRCNSNEIFITAVVVPEICADVLPAPNEKARYLQNLMLADVDEENIEQERGLSMLIGADYYWKVSTGEMRRITSELSTVKTIFGWTLQGPSPASMGLIKTDANRVSPVLATSNFDENIAANLWGIEILGIKADNLEREKMTTDLQNCIVKRGDRFEAALPWKRLSTALENNKPIAWKRVQSLIRKLSKNASDLLDYDKAMNELIQSGIAEPVINEEEGQKHYYMPHQPVYRFDKLTSKIRIVFDASSHAPATLSLNDHLHTGSNLLPDVLKMVLNFRLGKIGIIADIEKAFLQISLREADRDSHRFLWFSEPLKSANNLPSLSTYRMTRVTFGVTSSPFLLSATILKHLDAENKNFPETCSILKSSLYMDDLIVSVNDEDLARRIYSESNEVMKRASMTLRKWNSNSEEVRKIFNQVEVPVEQKVLGIKWDTNNDEIAPCITSLVEFLATTQEGTKRSVLQSISRIYDPLGLLSPVTIRLKILFQRIWKEKLDWDAPLTHHLSQEWKLSAREILALEEMYVPRNVYLASKVENKQIHIFADASQKAFGVVGFVRMEDNARNIFVRLLCAKSRVAPLKQGDNPEITLPRLELTAALLAARLKSYLVKSLKMNIDKFVLWTDSRISLYWITGDNKKWQPYITNRVREIRQLTNNEEWRHCPGKDNPADLLTRGVTASQLMNSEVWKFGPKWLSGDNSTWPNERASYTQVPTVLATAHILDHAQISEKTPLLNCEDFSSWRRLLRVTGYIMRFVNRAYRKKKSPTHRVLLTAEMKAAGIYWLKYVQNSIFSEEIVSLQMGKCLASSSKLLSLNPIVDSNGLLRVGGRLQSLQEAEDIVHPIILPDCHISRLIIKDIHQRMLHGGVNLTLSKLRERFWVIKGRQLIKKIVKGCFTCKKMNAKPLSQPFAPLPKERLRLVRPFAVVGIDFAGPLYIKESIEGPSSKAYILLFTCAAVRCIHLELVKNLTTDSCLMAMRRFISRRGVPDCIYSDNATTFKRASKDLSGLVALRSDDSFMNFLTHHRIEWKFIVERAPWWGGFWERLVRNIKDILRITIGKATLNFEQMQTFLTGAENVINERPLTYISNDPVDLTPLTPNVLLRGFRNIEHQGQSGNIEVTSQELRDVWQTKCRTTRYFAKRWKNEYMQLLRSFHNHGQAFTRGVKPGDVVLLHDNSIPRIHWKMAIIEKTFPGRDGRVRACEIRLANGSRTRRPVNLLYPLELQCYAGPEDVENYNK